MRRLVLPARSLPFVIETPVPALAGALQMHPLRIDEDGSAARVA
jgi:hypothetical protein